MKRSGVWKVGFGFVSAEIDHSNTMPTLEAGGGYRNASKEIRPRPITWLKQLGIPKPWYW